MKNQFIPYELAVKLKELGFDEVCLAFYDGTKAFTYSPNNSSIYAIKTLAPLWQQAFDWFREEHDLHYSIVPERTSRHRLSERVYNIIIYSFKINSNVIKSIVRDSEGNIMRFVSKENAKQACLEKLIELC